jgi:putative oxidoreductase
LVYFGVAGLAKPSETAAFIQHLIATAGGIFLLAGLWTPLIGTLVAFDEVWIASSPYIPLHQDTWTHIFLAVLSVSVAMLGPGAWSIDARLFGRKRFAIDRASGRRLSP